MKRLAIITTHPIQYNAPLFRLLHERSKLCIKVFYTWGKDVLENKFDPGFNKVIEWDLPLLEGYDAEFPENVATQKGSHHFAGIDNPGLIKDLQDWKADALLVYGWNFRSHLKVMCFFKGKIPVFFRGDSTLLQKRHPLKAVLRNIFLKWVYRHIDKAFYVGTHNKAYFKSFGLKDNQLMFAPHAIENERFQKGASSISEQQKAAWKNDLSIAPGDIVFLYAGKLDTNKRVEFLADNFLAANLKEAVLIIAGNGDKEAHLKAKFAGKENIKFLPFQNQQKMPLLYGMCDVFVLPSLAETWGLGINEAMAAGKPVLASEGCAAATDLVLPGINGYIFKENDLKEKLSSLTLQKKHLPAMGKASSEIISTWSFQSVCEIIEKNLSGFSL